MNGASQSTVPSDTCSTRCPANSECLLCRSFLSDALSITSGVETCGGPSVLELLFNPHPSPVPIFSPPVPTAPVSAPIAFPSSSGTWTATGCSQDGSSRALTGYSFASNSMTPVLCQNTCATKGFSIAGVEYGSECYCKSGLLSCLCSGYSRGCLIGGNEFSNNLGGSISDTECSMSCSGDPSTACGGSWALDTFKQSSGPARRSRHWFRAPYV